VAENIQCERRSEKNTTSVESHVSTRLNADLLAAACVELRLVEAAGLLQDRSLLDPPERGIIKPVLGIFVALLAPVRNNIMRGLGHDGFTVEITRSTRLRSCSVALAARSEMN
jgi:hypothetical protein